jgi:malonyl-CoA/methylmalonyl-CoA synthetase
MWTRNLFSLTLSRCKVRLSRDHINCSRYVLPSSTRMASTLPRLPLFDALTRRDAQRTAVVHSLSGRTFTYGELVNDVAAAKDKLQRNTGGQSAEGQRIAFLVENGYDYVGALSMLSASATQKSRIDMK